MTKTCREIVPCWPVCLWDTDLDSPTSYLWPSTLRVQWTLDTIRRFAPHRSDINKGGCWKVLCASFRWMIWHLEGKCQPDGKLNTSRAVVQLCLVPFVKFSKTLFLNSCHPPPPFTPPSLHPRWADRLFRSEEPIWNTVIGIDRNSTADRVQSTLCQWNTNTHCGVGFAVWGSRRPVLTLSDGPLFLTGLSQTVTAERRHVWS